MDGNRTHTEKQRAEEQKRICFSALSAALEGPGVALVMARGRSGGYGAGKDGGDENA
jgi:hypothetical protein